MTFIRRFIGGVLALWRRDRVEQDLDDELQAYIEASVEARMAAGLSREEAVRTTRAAMGSIAAVKDYTRDSGWEAVVESAWQDVRYGARALRKAPGFTAIVIVTLSIGIGANTAIFSVINSIMLRPLPVERPEALVALEVVTADDVEPVFSYAGYRQFATEGAQLADVFAASSVRRDAVTIDGLPEPVDYKWVSGNYFTTLGVHAGLGRTLVPSDDALPRGGPVAVLSDAYWTRRFGRDPAVIGRTFRFKAGILTIVGVTPRGYVGETLGEAPDVFLPLTTQPGAPPWLWQGHSTTWLRVLARRRAGISVDRARAGFEALYGRMRLEIAAGIDDPKYRATIRDSRLRVSEASRGSPSLRDSLAAPLLILMGLVALVLVIACANVASLMLARAAWRRRATAVRLALGATPVRIVREGLAEALLLAAGGGIAGLALGYAGSSVLIAMVSGALPVAVDVTPDGRVLAFTALVSSATALAFGLLPALRAVGVDPLTALKVGGGTSGRGGARIVLRRGLVVAQVAVSLVLLVAAALFARSLMKLQDIDPGFDADRVLLFQVAPSTDAAALTAAERRGLYRALLARAESVAGVKAASGSFSGVFGGETWGNAIAIEGFVPRAATTPRTSANAVTARYFQVLGIAVLRGRGFTEADDEDAPRVAVVNRTFARRFFGEANPIGRRVGLCASDPCGAATQMMEVVGMAEDAKYRDLREERRPMLYVPFAQRDQALAEVEVRTEGDPAAVAPSLHRALAGGDARLAIVGMSGLSERVDASLVAERIVADLSAAFGMLALLVAAVGLYGVVSYLTTQRTGEIGIRIALGASSRDVRRLVLRDTVTLVAIGVASGVPMALIGARLLGSVLYHIPPHDPIALSAALLALSIASVLATVVPARRATKVDPLIALRCE